jgi:Domain of unknown function (DUF4399)
MFKFSTGVIIAATIAAAIGPASAQQPSTPPAKPAASDTGQSPAGAGARAYIINLKNGDTVTSPFKVQFGLTSNMGIAPAGTDKENVGHHHLLIDTTLTPEEMTQPVMSDEKHVHYGKGQTEAMVTLPPGKHTLQLVLANWTHIPFNPPVQSEVITITVADSAKPVAAAAPKETPKETSKEAPKEVTKETPKEVAKQPKEAASDVKTAAPKEAPKEMPKQVSQDVKKEDAKKEAPKPVAQDVKKETPKEASKDAPKEASKEVKTEAPKEAKKDDEAKEAKVTHHHHHHHHRHYRHYRHHHREQYLHT